LAIAVVPALLAGCAAEQNGELARLREEVADLRTTVGPPPSSLDSLYPPVAAAPVLLLRMLELGEALSGVAVDVFEQDVEHARAGLERFRAEYAAVSRLVPEWEAAYPTGPVDALAAAVESGDPEQIGAAFEGVGAVCHECHVVNMAKVHFQYRWGDFGKISLRDPMSGRELSYRQLMQEMETAFVGIGTDLRQQQTENARAQFATFRTRFNLLTTVCVTCHATERKYFIDAGVQQAVQRLGEVLQSDIPNATLAMELAQEIGEESCSKCHLVHGPAALTKALWEGR
jgi:mono/diheme cytochrome c family protein